jgi:hypothetical protein
MARAAVVVLAASAAGCGGARGRSGGGGDGRRCSIPDYAPAVAGASGMQMPLAAVRPFRNHYAIGDVSPPAHLYTVWYSDIAPTVMKLRVTEDAAGVIRVEQAGEWWGGLGVKPATRPPAPPAELAQLTRAVEDAVAPCGSDVLIAYSGRHRVLQVYELISHGRIGWYATAHLHADGALTRIEDVAEQESGFGLVNVPASARWVAFAAPPGANGTTLLLASRTPALDEAYLAAARELDAGAPAPALESLVPAGDTALVPAGFAQDVDVEITIYGRASDFDDQQGDIYRVTVPVGDAVFGGSATGRTTVEVGNHAFVLAATLTSPPRAPAPERARADFAGTLAITVDGGPRHRFSRSYPVTGPIELEGRTVVAPTGFVLPGGSSSDPAYERRRAALPGDDQFESFDVYVGINVFGDPRR